MLHDTIVKIFRGENVHKATDVFSNASSDNLFFPFVDEHTGSAVLLTPDIKVIPILKRLFEESITQVFMGKVLLTNIKSWKEFVYDPETEIFEHINKNTHTKIKSWDVCICVAELHNDMTKQRSLVSHALQLTHAAAALTLIGCQTNIETIK